jgi:hemolysin activation/secretion protein
VETIVRRLNDHLIACGYVATRLDLVPQNLSGGRLNAQPKLGRVRAVRSAEVTSFVPWRNAPPRPGDLLSIPDK